MSWQGCDDCLSAHTHLSAGEITPVKAAGHSDAQLVENSVAGTDIDFPIVTAKAALGAKPVSELEVPALAGPAIPHDAEHKRPFGGRSFRMETEMTKTLSSFGLALAAASLFAGGATAQSQSSGAMSSGAMSTGAMSSGHMTAPKKTTKAKKADHMSSGAMTSGGMSTGGKSTDKPADHMSSGAMSTPH